MMLAREAGSLAACLRGLPFVCEPVGLLACSRRLLASAASAPPSSKPHASDANLQPTQRGRQRRAGLKPASGRGLGSTVLAEDSSLKWGQDVVVKQDGAGDKGKGRPSGSLAHRNAPVQVFQLIGDPRTGVADDTTSKPWGELTVDLVHEAYRTQVSWYKYDLAGNELQETHRDARLSDYTRNLIYLLRAKDPSRWSVAQLARKFRIRPQRVLAILATKEMEAQAVERGQLLGGALRGYALPVHLHDLHLDANGEPLDFLKAPAASAPSVANAAVPASGAGQVAASRGGGGSSGGSATLSLGSISEFVDLDTGDSLPTTAAQEAAAADELAAASGDSLPAAVAAVHDMAGSLAEGLRGALGLHAFSLDQLQLALEGQLAQAESFCQQHFADCPDVAAAADLPARRTKVQRLLAALAPFCAGDGLHMQSTVERLKGLAQQLQALQPTGDALDEAQQAQLQHVVDAVVALLPEGPQPASVQQLVVALEREGRRAVLEAVEPWRSCLHGAGMDVAALIAMGGRYMGLHDGGAEGAAGSVQAPVFGGVEVAEAQLQELEAALLDVVGPSGELQADAQQVAGAMKELRRLWWEYLSANEVGNDLLEAWGQLLPADCDALQACTTVQQAAEEHQPAAEADAPARPSQQLAERYRVEQLAAYLDYCVAGRVFDRGSGERHFVRLPTYPTFEGAPVRLVDQVRESEMSALNREAAKSEDAALFRQFQDALVDNLGLNEELLGQVGMAVAQPRAGKERSLVVHPYGSTRPLGDGLPSTYVATAGKQLRALNELELQYLRSTDPRRRRRGVR